MDRPPASGLAPGVGRRCVLRALPGLGIGGAAASARPPARPSGRPPARLLGTMLFARVGPTAAALFIARLDGTGERPLLADPAFDYHARPSADGTAVVFTSERSGLGQAELYVARLDGSRIRRLTNNPAIDDQGALSPDASRVAFISDRGSHRAGLWLLELASGRTATLTGGAAQGDPDKPDGFFRPAWSPDGRWIAVSSDRNSDWRGHDDGHGWEHTQELSIYVVQADGTGFRRIAARPGFCLGSPRWSPDGRRVVFYEVPVEGTWGARRPDLVASVTSQIVSVDVATGDRVEHTTGPGLKLFPQFLAAGEIAYQVKAGPDAGLHATTGRFSLRRTVRSPAWLPGQGQVIYEKTGFKPYAQNLPVYSWLKGWDYRLTNIFPALSRDGRLAVTEINNGAVIATMQPDGSDRTVLFDPKGKLAFGPAWSPDGSQIAFGYGRYFLARQVMGARLMLMRSDGSGLRALTGEFPNAGFPSWSPDGRAIVYRVWGQQAGLRVLDVRTGAVRQLTSWPDNSPDWSPDGRRIVFTRKVDAVNFDIFTIQPDGGGLARLTTSRANDGHAVWSRDGRAIYWTSGMYGFKDEAALYDDTFQPYGQIMAMNPDGSGKRILTDSPWEDAEPRFVPGAS